MYFKKHIKEKKRMIVHYKRHIEHAKVKNQVANLYIL